MKRSPEIEKTISDFLAAFERGDTAYLERMQADHPGVVTIGTDANEYVRGHNEIINAGRVERANTPQMKLGTTEVHAYEHGDVGWSDSIGYLEIDGQSVEVRNTSVYLRESGEWHGVQSHSSIGVPNERMFDPMFQRHKAAT
jgi:ketosteroid isomerase-like protein